MKMLENSVIFPLGEKYVSQYFNKSVWYSELTATGSTCLIGNVTFEPGCRNNWHRHGSSQILLVTGGKGYYQEWGHKPKVLLPGDVIEIKADIKHWHGASKESWFVHLAVDPDGATEEMEWLEPVTDEEYAKLK